MHGAFEIPLASFKLALLPFAIAFSWLPEELDLLDGMTLGAGFGAALGGGIGLAVKMRNENLEIENMVVAGTIIGIVAGALVVAAGKLTGAS
ncbi:MAG TPA: hypothetical protein VLK89_07175 [Solirubrobacterales bacterium]|nr:hypothetical protein [Solirubrobacterales bacterium]